MNHERNDRLKFELEDMGFEVFAALRLDPYSEHAEERWAIVGMSDQQAIDFGRRYGQVAVFRVDATLQHVLGCLSEWRSADQGKPEIPERTGTVVNAGVPIRPSQSSVKLS
jgi:hypothetical protein